MAVLDIWGLKSFLLHSLNTFNTIRSHFLHCRKKFDFTKKHPLSKTPKITLYGMTFTTSQLSSEMTVLDIWGLKSLQVRYLNTFNTIRSHFLHFKEEFWLCQNHAMQNFKRPYLQAETTFFLRLTFFSKKVGSQKFFFSWNHRKSKKKPSEVDFSTFRLCSFFRFFRPKIDQKKSGKKLYFFSWRKSWICFL